MENVDYYTLKEVCGLLRVCRATVVRAAQRGEIVGFKIGNNWRFPKDKLLDKLAEKTDK